MPPALLCDLEKIDLSKVLLDRAKIAEILPHRDNLALIDALVHEDPAQTLAVGRMDVPREAFWTSGHFPGKVRTFKGQRQDRKEVVWAYPQPEQSPYVLEWKDLIEAIVGDLPYNEVPRGVQASLVTSMGRMAAHTGVEITYDQMLNCPHEMAPDVADFTTAGPAPVMPDADGKYPVPQPGIILDREYETSA